MKRKHICFIASSQKYSLAAEKILISDIPLRLHFLCMTHTRYISLKHLDMSCKYWSAFEYYLVYTFNKGFVDFGQEFFIDSALLLNADCGLLACDQSNLIPYLSFSIIYFLRCSWNYPPGVGVSLWAAIKLESANIYI